MTNSKVFSNPAEALADIADGASILIGGFAGKGLPENLLQALGKTTSRRLTLIYSAGASSSSSGLEHIQTLAQTGRIERIISPMPFPPGSGGAIEEGWQKGQLKLEILPLGVLSERLRAGGAGLGGVFLSTGLRTRFEEGKEMREIDGERYLLERPLKAEFALIKAQAADTFGSLVYRGAERNWGPVMAMASRITIAEVEQILEPGGLDPEGVVTPGIFVNRLVKCG